jgi:hypothetical protein
VALEHRRASDWIAELLSRKKVFVINSLLYRRAACGGQSPRRASNGAAVELSGRTGLGFAGV